MPGLPGGDQVCGEITGRVGVQRRVPDQQPVPQHAVGQVGQHVQIRGGGDVAAGDAALEQGPQGCAALGGEFGEDLAAVNGALEAVVPTLAVELAPLRVNAVSPGVIDTSWWHGLPEEQRAGFFRAVAAASPVRRVGTPSDVAAAIVYLAGAGFVTGTVLECAGGANLTVGAVAG